MKKKTALVLIILMLMAMVLIIFSKQARLGAADGLALAENTIIPSLAPLLIIFLLIMKTGVKDLLARAFGFISVHIFNLPQITFPAIFFGLIGGYPMGALLTNELLKSGDIDEKQARRLLRFNFCGGCGFIITAVGTTVLNNTKAGAVLFLSNVISSVIIGFALSFTEKRRNAPYYSYTEYRKLGDVLSESVSDAVKSLLNMTAFIILFCAFNVVIDFPDFLAPVIEITSGICTNSRFAIPMTSAYLAFGGFCIHFQLLFVVAQAKMKYADFLLFRLISAVISYGVSKILLIFIPIEEAVFSNASIKVAEFSSVNTVLSVLMMIGCFVIVMDIRSKKKVI